MEQLKKIFFCTFYVTFPLAVILTAFALKDTSFAVWIREEFYGVPIQIP
jgi:hypothetical protein